MDVQDTEQELVNALYRGEIETTEKLLDTHPDFLNSTFCKQPAYGFMPLALAIAQQHNALAETLIELINPQARAVLDEQRIRPEKSEVLRLWGANEKIKKLTGWRPKYSLREGLEETVEWMKQNLEGYKAEIYNI